MEDYSNPPKNRRNDLKSQACLLWKYRHRLKSHSADLSHCIYRGNKKIRDFDILTERAVKEGNPTYPVPVIWEKEKFKEVLKKLK